MKYLGAVNCMMYLQSITMSDESVLNISSEQIYSLYKEAGKEIPYTEAKFTHDSDILMGGHKKKIIEDSINRLGISHQLAEFHV